MIYRYNKELISQWIKESEKDDLPLYYRFSCLWTAFNHFLASKYQKDGDLKLLKEFYKDYSDKFIILHNSNEKLRCSIENLKKESPIRDMRPGQREQVIINDINLTQIFKAIYQIRCNLLHGSKLFDADRDNILVKIAYDILSVEIENILE